MSDGANGIFELSSLDGENGFVIRGIDTWDQVGSSVSGAGDINGDGIDDLILGSFYADPNGNRIAGESYVVFGTASNFDASIDLSSLDGTNGFKLIGIDVRDYSGWSVSSAGDINGDGYGDLIIGARKADPDGISNAGEIYVVFGSASGNGGSLDLSSLDGSNGFVINGIDAFDQSGFSVSSAGDINGDGYGDLIIGAPYAEPSGNLAAGESYVVFGKASGFGVSIDLSGLDGTNGFVVNGAGFNDRSGRSVAGAGDLNGDGFDDLIIGAGLWDNSYIGESYVLFGKPSGFDASVDLSGLDGNNGFTLIGIEAYDYSGTSVAGAGDLNGDGFDDLIIGAPGGDPNGANSGEAYVIYGQDFTPVEFTSASSVSFVENANDIVLDIAANDGAGDDMDITYSITGGTDADSFTIDSATGKLRFVAPPDFENPTDVGANNVYNIDVTATDGEDNFAIQSISITVTNAIETVVITTPVSSTGSTGNDTITGGTASDTLIGGAGDDQVSGGAGADIMWAGKGDEGNDTVKGGAGADVIGGGAGDDFIEGDDGSDTLYGGVGDDLIYVTSKDNENGDFSSNVAWGGQGLDTLYGGLGDDILGGGAGDDSLSGGWGADVLFGGAGNDILRGDKGDDTLYGGAGADIFVFAGDSGEDRINGFDIGEDMLDLQNVAANFTSLDDVIAAAIAATMGGKNGVTIDLGEGNSVFLSNLTLDDLSNINLII